ncbi:hypothetical protein D9M71_416660 [compost metagenome]
MLVLRVWSSKLTLPWSKPMAPMSSCHLEGSAFSSLGPKSKTQLARPSARRVRLAVGLVRLMRGMLICWNTSGSGARRNSTRSRPTIFGSLSHSGLPRVRSSAMKRGQGSQARQPPCCGSRCQATARLPLIAKGRCSASETLALRVGLTRFQSNVAMTITSKVTTSSRLARVQVRILAGRVIA